MNYNIIENYTLNLKLKIKEYTFYIYIKIKIKDYRFCSKNRKSFCTRAKRV